MNEKSVGREKENEIMSGVARPHSINYPCVYYTFEAQDLHSNRLIEYRVEDFPRHRFEEGIQFMVQNFFEHEVMGKTRQIKNDRTAVQEISTFWREMLPKGFSVACFKKNSDEIIAMNVLDVSSVKDPKDDSKVNFFHLSYVCFICFCLFSVSISKHERCFWSYESCPAAI